MKNNLNYVNPDIAINSEQQLCQLLDSNLDFQGSNGKHATHAWHPFPAKFPPQLPQHFIENLTSRGDVVLDPMMGSGTTLVEAARLGRKAAGCDIDPLARLVASVKLAPPDYLEAMANGSAIASRAQERVVSGKNSLLNCLNERVGPKTKDFIDYWFLKDTQAELVSLILEIEEISKPALRDFFKMVFSSTIIAKTEGVSLARDLAHTRPHRDSTKIPKSSIAEFCRILQRNLKAAYERTGDAEIHNANTMLLPFPDSYANLVVTSPPYANNAIDYMRAHKFSLVWFGYPIEELSALRARYIGHDAAKGHAPAELPDKCEKIVLELEAVNQRKAVSLRRYFDEMRRTAGEIYRVVKRGGTAVVVVGSSVLSGVDTKTHICIAELGKEAGFYLAGIGTRQIDRNRRMMPARLCGNLTGIEKRMHKEHVIGFLKK